MLATGGKDHAGWAKIANHSKIEKAIFSLSNPLYWKVPTTLERNYRKDIKSNGIHDIIEKAFEEMKSEQGENYSLDRINLTESQRRAGISSAKFMQLK